ncbi:MAG: ECF transporter S component [Oscillospiraceae bacterium]|nr:ECF transporter S component [Oscillospiraceae bacterium]
MNNTITLNKKKLVAKASTLIIAIAGAVALPQVFHLIGWISGTGAAVGTALLPMHIPVLLAGFMAGPVIGGVAGVISPIISFLISGMPAAAILPFMMIELGVYGLTAGLLSRTKLNSFISLVLAQLAGRIARAAAVLIAVYFLGNSQLTPMAAVEFITAGLFGILIQWALIPALMQHTKGLKKLYE